MSPLYYNKTTFPVQANDLSKDWKLRWLHYYFVSLTNIYIK